MRRYACKQAVAPDVVLEIWLRSRLGVSPTGTAVIDGFAGTSRRRCLRTTFGKFRRLDLLYLREVIMTMSEYEERFRPPAPSLHQTFAEVRGPNRGGKQRRRLWVTAALLGVMTITSKAALHHSSHANGSAVSKSAIQACDFIHR